jgi:hypothetical protein
MRPYPPRAGDLPREKRRQDAGATKERQRQRQIQKRPTEKRVGRYETKGKANAKAKTPTEKRAQTSRATVAATEPTAIAKPAHIAQNVKCAVPERPFATNAPFLSQGKQVSLLPKARKIHEGKGKFESARPKSGSAATKPKARPTPRPRRPPRNARKHRAQRWPLQNQRHCKTDGKGCRPRPEGARPDCNALGKGRRHPSRKSRKNHESNGKGARPKAGRPLHNQKAKAAPPRQTVAGLISKRQSTKAQSEGERVRVRERAQ